MKPIFWAAIGVAALSMLAFAAGIIFVSVVSNPSPNGYFRMSIAFLGTVICFALMLGIIDTAYTSEERE